MTHSDVKRLQELLNTDSDTQIAQSGVGSPGNETDYFGSLTKKAVQRFQKKYSVASEGDAGYGYVGPATRAKLSEVFGGGKAPVQMPPKSSAVQNTQNTQEEALQEQIESLLQQIQIIQQQIQESQ